MNEHAPHVGVGILITNRQGEVLLGLRRGEHESIFWGLPGGKLEYGETIFECARREVQEEAGLTITQLELMSVSDDVPGPQAPNHFVTIGVAAYTEDEPHLREPQKCREWRWFSFDALPEHIFAPSKRMLDNKKENILYREEQASL